MIMMDSAFALSAGVVFLALVFLFHALNVLAYKARQHEYDTSFGFIIGAIILCGVICFSRIAYMAHKFPWMDYKGIISNMLYLPFTIATTGLALLIFIKAIVGKHYPRRWIVFAVISGLIALTCYVLL